MSIEGCLWIVCERTPRARAPPAESPARMILDGVLLRAERVQRTSSTDWVS